MGNGYKMDLLEFRDLFRSLKEYLYYLLDSGMQDMSFSEDQRAFCQEVSQKDNVRSSKSGSSRLEEIQKELENCKRCKLASTRTKIVFGEGDPNAKILFIGEGPGYEEDQTGRPFVGKAGKKLSEIIERGMGITRNAVYICNIVKCRPPENRNPHEDEVSACLPFLEKQIDTIRPHVIITLGFAAASAILGVQHSISQVRGRWHFYKNIPVMPTYHPAFLLRNYTPTIRRQVWDDVQEAIRVLNNKGKI